MQVVVIAGGAATRMEPLTRHQPKALLPVGGRPFLDLVLDLLDADESVTSVHFCLGRHGDQIIRFLADRPTRLEVTWTLEPRPLGTAGCLRLAAPQLDDRFLVLLGDTYTPIDLGAVAACFAGSGAPALMVVFRNRDALERSNVKVAGGHVLEYNKAASAGTYEFVDYGVAALRRDVIARLPAGRAVDLGEIFLPLIAEGGLASYEVTTRFFEIGSVAGYRELDELVSHGDFGPRRVV